MTGDTPRPGEAEAVTRVWASGLDLNCSGGEVRAIIANAYPEIAAAVRERDDDLLIQADSLLSLIRYREAAGLSQQTIRDLDSFLGRLRRRTAETVRSGR
jgi:hypothetical protein